MSVKGDRDRTVNRQAARDTIERIRRNEARKKRAAEKKEKKK
jgi:hypothetical protein